MPWSEKRLSESTLDSSTEAGSVAPTTVTVPTPTPTPVPYWPTQADYNRAYEIFSLPWYMQKHFQEQYVWFAVVYIASECAAEKPRTSEGFRSFVKRARPQSMLSEIARSVIEEIISAKGNNLTRCKLAFMYPETEVEVELAVRLYAAYRLAYIPSYLRDSFESILDPMMRYASWLESGQNMPFLEWLQRNMR